MAGGAERRGGSGAERSWGSGRAAGLSAERRRARSRHAGDVAGRGVGCRGRAGARASSWRCRAAVPWSPVRACCAPPANPQSAPKCLRGYWGLHGRSRSPWGPCSGPQCPLGCPWGLAAQPWGHPWPCGVIWCPLCRFRCLPVCSRGLPRPSVLSKEH